MILIVCGPPHSGKSVFVANLIKQLPTEDTMAIRACPDGEGTWSNNPGQIDIQSIRRKGSFTFEFLVSVLGRINNQTADLILVDVGGVRSKDNKKIFKTCKTKAESKETECCFLVISSDKDETQRWIEFGEECGCKCFGVVDSELEGLEEVFPEENGVFRAKITGLERGTYLDKSKVIQSLVSKIMKKSKMKSCKKSDGKIKKIIPSKIPKTIKETIEGEYFDGYMIDGIELGFELGYGDTKPDGGRSVYWTSDAIPKVYEYMAGLSSDITSLGIYGVRPNFVIAAMCKAAKQQKIEDIEIFDVNFNKMVTIKELPQKEGIEESGCLEYYVLESDSSVFLDVIIPTGKELHPLDYIKLVLPKIDSSKKLFISGRIPLWLLSSIVCSYDSTHIYTMQPGKGFTCVASQEDEELGKTVLIDEVDGIDIRKHFDLLKVKSDQQRLQEAEARRKLAETTMDWDDKDNKPFSSEKNGYDGDEFKNISPEIINDLKNGSNSPNEKNEDDGEKI